MDQLEESQLNNNLKQLNAMEKEWEFLKLQNDCNEINSSSPGKVSFFFFFNFSVKKNIFYHNLLLK